MGKNSRWNLQLGKVEIKKDFLSLGHFQYQTLLKADNFSIRVQIWKAQQKTEKCPSTWKSQTHLSSVTQTPSSLSLQSTATTGSCPREQNELPDNLHDHSKNEKHFYWLQNFTPTLMHHPLAWIYLKVRNKWYSFKDVFLPFQPQCHAAL